MKKLSGDEDQNNAASTKSLKEKQEIQLFCYSVHLEIIFYKCRMKTEKRIPVDDVTLASFSKSIFHPPSV